MHLHVLAVNWKQSRLHGLFSDIMARIHGLFHPQKRHNIWGLEAQNICPWPGETCRISLKIIQELKDTGSVLSWHPLFILNPTLTNKTSFWHHVFWGMHYFFLRYPPLYFNEQNPVGNRTFGSFASIDMVSRSKPPTKKPMRRSESWPNQSAILTS